MMRAEGVELSVQSAVCASIEEASARNSKPNPDHDSYLVANAIVLNPNSTLTQPDTLQA